MHSLRTVLTLAAALTVAAVTHLGAQTPAVAGSWKLNEAASNNPNGPVPDAPAARRGGGAGGGGKGTSVDVTGGSRPNQAVSELSPEETRRIKMMIGLLNKAAQVLEVVVEGNEVTIKQDGGGFPKQTYDGKKSVLKNPQVGEVDIKVKIDAKGMTREVVTQDDLKVVETYALSADGKQLVVTLKASQPVMKIEDAKIKRVYDRQ